VEDKNQDKRKARETGNVGSNIGKWIKDGEEKSDSRDTQVVHDAFRAVLIHHSEQSIQTQ